MDNSMGGIFPQTKFRDEGTGQIFAFEVWVDVHANECNITAEAAKDDLFQIIRKGGMTQVNE